MNENKIEQPPHQQATPSTPAWLDLDPIETSSETTPPNTSEQPITTTDQTQPAQTEQPVNPIQNEQEARAINTQKLFFGEKMEGISPEEKTRRETLKAKWQEAFARVSKGLGERGIFDPEIASEITHRLIEEVHLSYELYKGDPMDPVCCVDQNTTGKVIVAPELIEGIKKPDMSIGQCDIDYVINHELGHLMIHKSLIYQPRVVEAYLSRAAAILEAQKRGERINTTNMPPEMVYVLTSLEKAMENPNVLKGETRYIQELAADFSAETDQDGKTNMQKKFEKFLQRANEAGWALFGVPAEYKGKYDQMDEENNTKSFEKFKAHQLKQIAEEMLNERLTCYLASDGTEAGYWQQFMQKMRSEDPDALAKCFEAKGVDPEVIEQVKTLIDDSNLTNQDKYDQFQQLLDQDQTGKMAEYFAVHKICFEQFKNLSNINKEQLSQTLEDDELDIDIGIPYYEESSIGASDYSGGGGSGGGESWNDKIWRVVFGVK